MKLYPCAPALALAAGSMSAQAISINIGTLPLEPATYSVGYDTAGEFADTFNFIAPAASATASGVASAVFVPDYSVGDVKLALYTADNVLVASGTGISTGGIVTLSALTGAPLSIGSGYYFKVSGVSTGAMGGKMNFLASAQPVPEPHAAALMVTGLAIISLAGLRLRARAGGAASRHRHG